jgi:hypothetical protein
VEIPVKAMWTSLKNRWYDWLRDGLVQRVRRDWKF